MSNNVRSAPIKIEQAQLDDLRARLSATRWPDEDTTGGDWRQGIPLSYVRELCAYWQNDYDWRRVETQLNELNPLQTTIDEVDIHFFHICSPHEDAMPLIMTHGWPGSPIEFLKVVGPLTNPTEFGGKASDAFHLVLPNLPGYGFSGKPVEDGWNVEKIGRAWGTLMQRLGYERYVAQGGDWGGMVTTSMGITETTHCAAIHTNLVIAAPDPDTMDSLSDIEQKALEGISYYDAEDSGYSKQQGTRPQTLGYGLADSPSGQLAWIVEKFWSWTDSERDGKKHPENVLGRDELLDNVMFYWLNNAAASSARLYWESFKSPSLEQVDMPTGCSIFPKEIFLCSRRWAEKRFTNLIHWNELDKGGHFAAFEQPDLFVDEIRNCFRVVR